ncbi:MAG TPA: amidohydrolase family protein [Xanthobacteraceae bacterium]|jgi:cytosine/adenosine deaminase-related metal-dependent hydrolase
MIAASGWSRRRALQAGAALGALAIAGQAPAPAAPAAASSLPARGNVVIRGAYVMTMEADAGDIKDGDVHVSDGAIVAVGRNLDAPGATALDGAGMIVLPGLVETHWHMWNTLLRSMSGEKPELGYFRTTAALGQKYQPADMYQGTRLAAAEAINSGITSVHDWCHNIRSPDYADQDLRALRESGLRARFSYGAAQGMPNNQGIALADLERLARNWPDYSNDGLITLGLAWRGMGGNNPATAIPPEIYKAEIEAGRKLGLPISVHASGSRPAAGQVATIAKAGLLARDMQIIHANFASPEEIDAMAKAGASVSLSPFSELRIGFGMQHTGRFLAAGIPVGLSVDTVELTGNADMFGIMKLIQNLENGEAESEFKLNARRVLELATIEGARSMGIADKVGSLKVGKRADLIMVATRDINLGVFGDPAHMLVTAAQPANVDTVLVDGRILKQGGKLSAMNAAQIATEAAGANAALRKRANWW